MGWPAAMVPSTGTGTVSASPAPGRVMPREISWRRAMRPASSRTRRWYRAVEATLKPQAEASPAPKGGSPCWR